MANLSKKALEVLYLVFSENSNVQLPVAVAKQVVEIREWAEKELKKISGIEVEDKENKG